MENAYKVSVFGRPFGVDGSGNRVTEYSLRCGDSELVLIDRGCTLLRMNLRDKDGHPVDAIIGCGDMGNCLLDSAFMGHTVGRVCNRTENARFTLNGKEYTLPANDGVNHLHGVFSTHVFDSRIIENGVEMTYVSPDGEEGYPGCLTFTVRVTMTAPGEVLQEYIAVSDADTPINITNHTYFNLAGTGDIKGHTLWLGAGHFCEGRPDNCPTGRILPVQGTPMDFTSPRSLGSGLDDPDEQMKLARGYDHNFVLDKKGEDDLSAVLCCPENGLRLRVYTSQPGLQVYTGNYLWQNAARGKDGQPFVENQGVALETQHFPCSLSHPEFPGIILKAGETFRQYTRLCFDIV